MHYNVFVIHRHFVLHGVHVIDECHGGISKVHGVLLQPVLLGHAVVIAVQPLTGSVRSGGYRALTGAAFDLFDTEMIERYALSPSFEAS